MTQWTSLLDKYGWPAFILMLIAMFFWRGLWPMIKRWVETTNEARMQAEKFLHEQIRSAEAQVQRSEARNIKITDDFLEALDRLQESNEQTVKELERISNAMEKNRK